VFGLFIPLLAVLLCGLVLLSVVGWGLFWFLIQLGVIIRKAQEPPHTDTGTYELRQGRDIGSDERR
jgi:hypothetical protein